MESELEHLPSRSLFGEKANGERDTHESRAYDSNHIQRQLELVRRMADQAKDIIQYESAHDESILHSIHVVETFLRKRHRICYGGQAINAYLPAAQKFYDPDYSIPDYDFFTPDQNADLEELATRLFEAGFRTVSARPGMHEGTLKLYVNYIPVADLTAMDGRMYRMLSRRARQFDGITYIDPNSLRMLMYLELSRPRGEVERWEKVYERLLLFNQYVPRSKKRKAMAPSALSKEQAAMVLDYVMAKGRVLAGADLVPFYEHSLTSGKPLLSYLLQNKKPILLFSPDAKGDATALREAFELRGVERGERSAVGMHVVENQGLDVIPAVYVLHTVRPSKAMVFVIQQSACHSYVSLSLKQGMEGKSLRIASMDTLITLYFSLGMVQSRFVERGAMEALANQLVELSIRARRDVDRLVFPFLSIACSGVQPSLPSLIQAKLERMTPERKEALRAVLNRAERAAQTRKAKAKRRGTVRKPGL